MCNTKDFENYIDKNPEKVLMMITKILNKENQSILVPSEIVFREFVIKLMRVCDT